jgi:hypothetical protein
VLLLVSANDYWNWWWFLVQLQNALVAFAAVQPDIDLGPRTVMFLEQVRVGNVALVLFQ